MALRAVLVGFGHALPERVVENADFEAPIDIHGTTVSLETNDAWIKSRTGIERRHIAAEGQHTSDLATDAALAALKDAGVEAESIDAIIVATSTPDLTFPSAATMVQNKLGMTGGFAFDIQAVCAGFAFAMANANALIVSGQVKRALVIGAETFSRIMDWTDRGTCVLFGDGAGAVVLEAQDQSGTASDRGILATELNSDGRYKDILYVDGGVSTNSTGALRMQGKEVFRHAVEKLAGSAKTSLQDAGLTTDDIDWIVPHQANLRILKSTADKLSVPMDQVVVTVQDHGNTSAASIPLALSVARADGRLKDGQVVVTGAIGGGLAWGSVVFRL
ncbi:beta-ketoacyl-ACP synthase III [Shimia ponticola]|uniref:beta-ketoacyl-ACP synthase III n=1 Tax=Shimia ponticola TaxID=2582893 RepID=UPI0011BF79A9|nr:beta-ketoacyl-ACP synthase III [Shimia ponticola]